ncbi:iron complex transport system substrate-binding protein [Austwickia chelonae]|uniref:Putative iron-siderophore ABC transporter substrate-binding protein n=1 Tax=Austwickia chelonae NBRC 105200 TaxID=1184607 RepID=K6WAU1_9MICO|nr:Fe2+-enterobactin ABC transporter substrate-binding protein [Austwickia chelonae]GAB78967.1 putative iron-siderophore ABC transporter substrate-binding protein [Austwickia chelonae NBRC 105200]SEV87480.1 iron complex transport system substrate-binding protein [Austwickia chelonae]
MRRTLVLITSLLVALTISSCDSSGNAKANSSSSDTNSSAAATGQWPRKITHELGETTIKEKPKRIVSTSVVLTGSLLAVKAPVVASGASQPGGEGFDKNGFFAQWAKPAEEAGVKVLYQNSKFDLEAVLAAKPDLIIISASGGDSTKDNYQQLSQIAPTVAVNYNSQNWEQTTKEIAKATGQDAEGEAVVADYRKQIDELKNNAKLPSEPVQMIVFSPSNGSAFALPDGPHDQILQQMGVKLAPTTVENAKTPSSGKRKDFVFPSEEASVKALTNPTVLLVSADDSTVAKIKGHPAYQNIPAATSGKLVPLGLPSFKLDYYSALDMAKHLASAFPK